MTGFYPYSFMDATRIGYGRPLLDVAGLGLCVLALVAAFVWIDKRLPQRQPEIGLAPSCGPGSSSGSLPTCPARRVSMPSAASRVAGSEGSAIEDTVTAPKPAPHSRAARRATC